MKLLPLNNKAGFGIIEVMIAAGILSVISVGTMTLIGNTTKSQRGLEGKSRQQEVRVEMGYLFSNPQACLNTLGGNNPMTPFTVTALKDGTAAPGVDRYVVNTNDGSGLIRYTQFQITDWVVDPADANKGTVNLAISVEKLGDVIGPKALLFRVPLFVRKDAGNLIVECYTLTTGGSGNTFWEESPITAGSIFYSDGKVGVGNNNPLSPLHITSSSDLTIARFDSVSGSNGSILVNTTAAGNEASLNFASAGTDRWKVGKAADNSFFINDTAANRNAMTASTTGDINIAPTTGNVTIAPTSSDVSIGSSGTVSLATTTGTVGIRTTNPQSTFDVAGEIITRNRFSMTQNLTDTSGTIPTWHMDNSADNFRIYRQPNLSTAGSVMMNISNTGQVRATNEVQVSQLGTGASGQFRSVHGNYGVIERNDGGNYYMLVTNSGNQYGTWNGLRPFYFNLANGNVTMGHNLTVSGLIIGRFNCRRVNSGWANVAYASCNANERVMSGGGACAVSGGNHAYLLESFPDAGLTYWQADCHYWNNGNGAAAMAFAICCQIY